MRGGGRTSRRFRLLEGEKEAFHTSLIKRAYKFRYYPTAEQHQVLARTFGCCRWVYNQALACKSTAYREVGQHLSYGDLSTLLPVWKTQNKTSWLAAMSSVPLQQSLRHLDRACVNFFERREKYPKFKKKHGPQAATYTASAFTWKDGHLSLAKMESPLAIRWSRSLPTGATPTTVTVSRDPAGRFFVSLLLFGRVHRVIIAVPPALLQVFDFASGITFADGLLAFSERTRYTRLPKMMVKGVSSPWQVRCCALIQLCSLWFVSKWMNA